VKDEPSTTLNTAAGDEGRAPAALLEKIDRFPTVPGVYLMKDARSRIIYIGKAVNLRSRARSYFQKNSDARIFHQFLTARTTDVDCIVTASEAEALILENNLIKKHRPTYNIRLKDDKTYVSLKVTVNEEWPRVMVVRRYKDDGALYFGPYSSAGAVRQVLRVIKTCFPLRTCSNLFFRSRTRPCIEHEIGRCTAPCVGRITHERYLEDVSEVVLFLKGRNRDLLERLETKMAAAARERRYELAARYRDQIRAVEKVFEVQKAQDFRARDLDGFATFRQGEEVAIQELAVREGKIVHSHCHTFKSPLPTPEILGSFLAQFYLTERHLPAEVLSELDFPDRPVLEASLRARRGRAVSILVPQRGEKLRLVEMAHANAENAFQMERTRAQQVELLLGSLRERLSLPRPPRSIECFDISNFQGSLAVGAMVRFEEGSPVKDRYRKFRIQTVVGADDFRMMREVLGRRLRRGIDESDLPDLIMVDGGKGQLGVGVELFQELGIEETGLVALAKERRARGTTERLFVPGRPEPVDLSQDSPESLYLQRIRDEAHRFAIKYHRELRKKKTLSTGLEEIPGIGSSRRRGLIERFRTLEGIQAASEEEIAAVVGRKLGERVHRHFHPPPPEEPAGAGSPPG
jgi:excinuclease ABC subunit C